MKKLYRVYLRRDLVGPYYVVAEEATAAERCVIDNLNRLGYGPSRDRVMDRLEVVAEDCAYPNTARLFCFIGARNLKRRST